MWNTLKIKNYVIKRLKVCNKILKIYILFYLIQLKKIKHCKKKIEECFAWYKIYILLLKIYILLKNYILLWMLVFSTL